MAAPKNKALPSSFKLLGASAYEPPTRKSIVMTLDGNPNTGKTDIALQAPGPILIYSMDRGLKGVIEKYLSKKAIGVFNFSLPSTEDRTTYAPIWNAFHASYYAALKTPEIRTLIFDKGGDVWNLLRMSVLGGFSKIPSLKYEDANAMMRQLFKAAKEAEKNLIVTHEISKSYVTERSDAGKDVSVWRGSFDREGFSKIGYLVDAEVTLQRDGKTFSARFDTCKANMEIAGDEVELPKMRGFAEIMEQIEGEPYDPEEWE